MAPFGRIYTSLALIALLACAGGTAAAKDVEVPSPSLYIGVFGGYNLVLGDWDLHTNADEGLSPDSSPAFGGRIGVQMVPWLAFELGVAAIPYNGDAGTSGMALAYRGDLLLSPFEGRFSPFLIGGGGVYQGASGDFGEDADWEVHYGLGMRIMIVEWLAFRVEGRHAFTDSFGAGLASLVEVSGGFDIFVWGADTGPTPDTDGDAINDDDDLCPTVVGSVTAAGCPDRDGDGAKDAEDRCPSKPGPRGNQGCPDTDGDGLPDDLDECDDDPGTAAMKGCPEKVSDTDGDGFDDDVDGCPEQPGGADTEGCPDADGDKVADMFDACPHAAGLESEQGCLPKALTEKFSGAIEGIKFLIGSAKIRKKSLPLLDEAAALLQQFPSIRMRVEGHTDDVGPDGPNMKISQARADSVRNYLIRQGVDGSRLEATGFGETTPIGSNDTKEGRAKNRRIEFKLLF